MHPICACAAGRSPKGLHTRTWADAEGFDVTSRSMQKMVIGGLLKSEKGAHGGYTLIKDPETINVLDFMEMVVVSIHFASVTLPYFMEVVVVSIKCAPLT